MDVNKFNGLFVQTISYGYDYNVMWINDGRVLKCITEPYYSAWQDGGTITGTAHGYVLNWKWNDTEGQDIIIINLDGNLQFPKSKENHLPEYKNTDEALIVRPVVGQQPKAATGKVVPWVDKYKPDYANARGGGYKKRIKRRKSTKRKRRVTKRRRKSTKKRKRRKNTKRRRR